MAPELYIGLLSGTSIDCVDAALVDCSNNQARLLETHSEPIADELKVRIIELCNPGANEIDRLGSLDRQLGFIFARAANGLLKKARLKPGAITAIGSHGQTVRHRPAGRGRSVDDAFTLQIGDPNTIAENCAITTVADFRRRDIAANGQGAPLVPVFHRAAFSAPGTARAIINIGGMSNVSLIALDGSVLGFDTGPGNVLLDSWIKVHRGQDYDAGGAWAASGQILEPLLNAMLAHPFLAQDIPRSTGREDFNLEWLLRLVEQHETRPPVDVQATLLEYTARTICAALARYLRPPYEAYVCGGGAYNTLLMQRLQALLQPNPVATTAVLGLAPEWVEASAFAWFAQQTLAGRPTTDSAVTGASGPRILGGIFQA
jgi:anhydro-N-acetylmuramic acid kinase